MALLHALQSADALEQLAVRSAVGLVPASVALPTLAPQKKCKPVTGVTSVPKRCRHTDPATTRVGRAFPLSHGGGTMLNVLTFAVVIAALAIPLLVPFMWGQLEHA